jgi:hypothetical protein
VIRCQKCNFPLIPEKIEDEWLFSCSICNSQKQRNDSTFKCDCSEEGDVTYSTDIRILPGAGFLEAANDFINNTLKIKQFSDSFIIIGNTLRLIKLNKIRSDNLEYSLQNFNKWKTRARIKYQKASINKIKGDCRTLGRIKEKCKEKNYHPTKEDCQNCKISKMINERIIKGEYICLSRLFGFAIDEFFDGIHHGAEGADIQYEDIDADGKTWKIGIHLKSRNPNTKRCIGRGDKRIKGLYAQYCYSIYQINEGLLDEEIVGVSIPNTICPDVIASFKYLARRFKIPLLILQEEDWVRILHRAFEIIDLETHLKVPFESIQNLT